MIDDAIRSSSGTPRVQTDCFKQIFGKLTILQGKQYCIRGFDLSQDKLDLNSTQFDHIAASIKSDTINVISDVISDIIKENFKEELSPLEDILNNSLALNKENCILHSISEENQIIRLFDACIRNADKSPNFSKSEKFKSIKEITDDIDQLPTDLYYNEGTANESYTASSRATPPRQTDSERSGHGASETSMSQIRKEAEAYRKTHKERSPINNNNIQGSIDDAIHHINSMMSSTSIFILGEGSHQDRVMDEMLLSEKFFECLKSNNIKYILAEHIYDKHLSALEERDSCHSVVSHLSSTAFGDPNKALKYATFLSECFKKGITVIAVDKPSIYKPVTDGARVSASSYTCNERIEALNGNILSKINQINIQDSQKKIMIIVGAAHTNHHNAKAFRLQQLGLDMEETSGLTEVLGNAQEMIIIPETTDGIDLGLKSVKNGCVFEVKEKQSGIEAASALLSDTVTASPIRSPETAPARRTQRPQSAPKNKSGCDCVVM